MKNMQNDCELISKKNNFDFTWNVKFPINSLYIMRGYLFVPESEKKNYLDIFFDAYWKNNLDLSDEKILIQLLKFCKIENRLLKINRKFYVLWVLQTILEKLPKNCIRFIVETYI